MKKVTMVFIYSILLLSLSGIASATVLLDEDFDSYSIGSFPTSGGWILKYNGWGNSYQIVDNSQSVSAPNSFKLEGAPNWGAAAYHPLSETPDQITYEVDMKVTQPGSTVMNYHDAEVTLFNPNSGTWGTHYAAVRFGKAENRIIYLTGTTETMPYNFNQWYHVKVSVDNILKTYSVWIDGTFLGTGNYGSTAGNYNSIMVEGSNNAHTRNWYDNLKVYDTPTSDGFTFAHLTDVHIGDSVDIDNIRIKTMKESVERFSDTLQSIKNHDPDFMLVTGDLVEYYKPAYFQAYTGILESVEIPVYNTPGNHDRRGRLIDGTIRDNNLNSYRTYIEPSNNDANHPIVPFGDWDDYYFDWGGYRFIGLDSGADYNISDTIAGYDKTPESDGLKETQLTELKDIASEKSKIIFMHHPSLSDINDVKHWNSFEPPVTNNCKSEYFGNDGSIASFRCNFIEYSVNNNVDLVLTGHTHKDNFTIIPNEDGTHETWFIQTRSATKDKDSFNHGYRVITIDNGIVTRNETETTSSLPKYVYTLDASTPLYGSIFGISAFDQGRHTGMDIYGNVDRDIPESYYTGIYDVFSVPQVLVLYNEPESVTFHSDMQYMPAELNIFQKSLASTQSTEEMHFNITVSHQTETETIEYRFENVYLTESSIASVNNDNDVYTLEIDHDGDGVIDDVKEPDSILLNGVIQASININPNSVNLKSKGKWITAYIELSNVESINVSTLNLIDQSEFIITSIDPNSPATIGDYDYDGNSELMVKFDRKILLDYLKTYFEWNWEIEINQEIELTITGELVDKTPFEGSETIRIINA